MIVGIISGYYRTGTTIMQKIYEEATGIPVLHEPTQHEIVKMMLWEGATKPHSLHGFEIFKGYTKIPFDTLKQFIKRHFEVFEDKTQHGVMTDFSSIVYLLQPFHECDVKVIIKTNQAWLHLDKLAKTFDCWIIHLMRHPVRIVAEHTTDRNLLESKDRPLPFYTNEVFTNLRKYLKEKEIPANRVKNIVKLRYILEKLEEIVKEQAKRCNNINLVDFDDFVMDPERERYKYIFGKKVIEKAKQLLDRKKIPHPPEWLYRLYSSSFHLV